MKERWPEAVDYNEITAGEFERLQALITEVRFVATELPVKGGHALLYGQDSLIESNAELVKRLARLESVSPTDQPRGLRLAVSGREAWLDIDEKTLKKHREALENRLETAKQRIASLEGRLNNKTYREKAPEALVEESRKQLTEQKALVARLENELAVI
jgi:valyl-tRNA synthetase